MEIRTEKGSQINDNVPTYPKFVLENRIKKRSYLKTTFSQPTEYFIELLFFIVDTEVPKIKTASKIPRALESDLKVTVCRGFWEMGARN